MTQWWQKTSELWRFITTRNMFLYWYFILFYNKTHWSSLPQVIGTCAAADLIVPSVVSWVFCISFDKDVPVKCNLFPPLPSWLCPETPRHSLTAARSYMHKQNVIAIKGNVTANQRQPSLSRWRALSILHSHRSAWSASTLSRNNNTGLIFSEAWHKFPLSPTAWRQIEILR